MNPASSNNVPCAAPKVPQNTRITGFESLMRNLGCTQTKMKEQS
jgi:hypothetical protein